MTKIFWVWCDLDEQEHGYAWRLAVERGDKLYFPVEDYTGLQEAFESCFCEGVYAPAGIPGHDGTRII